MAILFGEYELLAQSGLFDPEYYVKNNPDIAALNVDPLLHYLECGCREGRNPSADFDTSYYLSLFNGDKPANPLAHYLTVGINRGLAPKAKRTLGDHASSSARAEPASSMLSVDLPRTLNGTAVAPVQDGLSIVGWAIFAAGASGVDIALDGVRVVTASRGMRRPDVAAVHPKYPDALQSGFAAHLPPKVLPPGRHLVTVSVAEATGASTSVEFAIEVPDAVDDRGTCVLRRKMSQVEIDLHRDTLTRLDAHPTFRVYLPVDGSTAGTDAARRTIASFARQAYPTWELHVLPASPTGKAGRAQVPVDALLEGFDDIRAQVRIVTAAQLDRAGGEATPPTQQTSQASSAPTSPARILVARLQPGDEWGVDACLEFALAGGFDRDAEFFFADERRAQRLEAGPATYFKPGWSPDLHLSTNYVGRAWCADARAVARAGLTAADFANQSDYDLSLRLTEAVRRIGHVAKVLHQSGEQGGDTAAQEVQALKAALARRKIVAEINPGALAHHYRIKRKLKAGRVSIVIPTCAADGLIKTCLETLKDLTKYRNTEIVCIENIPKERRQWKRWLRAHADVVIETRDAFNWSRFNNLAAARASGPYLLFLNDDIEVIDGDWLGAMLEQAQRPEVGVVGPLLSYPDRRVQHAGVMLDQFGRGRHAFRHLAEKDPGYHGLALTQRNVISVTGACLLTRRDTFERLGRFNEAHAVINNDLDYCLKSWRSGLLNVYTPHAQLIHHELASRSRLEENYDAAHFQREWRALVATGDPYFNVNLSRDHDQLIVEREPIDLVYVGHPLFKVESIRRILVLKLDHIGDSIAALPALRQLKAYFPQARITVLAGRATLSVWANEPVVDETIEFNFFHARSGLGRVEGAQEEAKVLAVALERRRFDLAIDLRKQPDTREILRLSGAPILCGYDHRGRFPWLDVALEWDEDVPLTKKHAHVSDDLMALVQALGRQGSTDRAVVAVPQNAEIPLSKGLLHRLFSKPLICIHPVAGSPMRQWSLDKYVELIELLLATERVQVALIGGADDAATAGSILKRLGKRDGVFDLFGKLSLKDLPKLLRRAALFVGNNSGPQHVAAGLGVPTLGIHSGVVDAREWGPLGARAVAIRRDMSCSPCYIEKPADCPRALACLNELSAATVFANCLQLLADPSIALGLPRPATVEPARRAVRRAP